MSILDYDVEPCRNVNCNARIYLIFMTYEQAHYVYCTRCQTSGPPSPISPNDAIERWNNLQKVHNNVTK